MIQEAIKSAIDKNDLPYETARQAMLEIMRGTATQAQIASFLTALRMKGESIDEITACAAAMRECCTRLPHDMEVLDIVGTGGDEAFTFNISTVSAFVAAAGGVPVAKHGNRSVSSKCGAADVLEALGVKLDLTAEQNAKVLRDTGICFMFAPVYHASMKHAAPVRREMGTRTIFNILGPLANPAGATMQLLGVYNAELLEPLAQALMNLGVRRALVVHGDDGLDEITLTAATQVYEIKDGKLSHDRLDPADYGFALCAIRDITGGDAAANAAIAMAVLGGQKGPKRDIVLLNAGACLYIAGKSNTISEGAAFAAELIDSGAALTKMDEFIRATNEAEVAQ
jgi:anthranilate phosphoribosyltransferase